jgi:Flp pilus assembly protein TadG
VTRFRSQSGQTMVTAVIFLTMLLGMTAAVVDVGSWFRVQRAAQSAADAAALAGAQQLPADPAAALDDAVTYAGRNGGGLAPTDVAIEKGADVNDTIEVHVRRKAQGFFSSIVRIFSVDVSADAAARGFKAGSAKYVAPIVVNIRHKLLCPGIQVPVPVPVPPGACNPQYNVPTTLTLGPAGAPGAFDMLNLIQNQQNGTVGTSTLGDWLENGFNGYLSLDRYYSDPGAKFNSSAIRDALRARIAENPVLLFPVYDVLDGNGSNAQYRVVAWVAFKITDFDMSGNSGWLKGEFTSTIWDAIQTTTGDQAPDLGVHSVALVK